VAATEGIGETVGLSVGWGPGLVGATVGAALTHFGIEIPKHASPAGHPDPLGQGVAVKQFCSASWYVTPQKRVLGVGAFDGSAVLITGAEVGLDDNVGLSVGWGPESVGAAVGEALTHFGIAIP